MSDVYNPYLDNPADLIIAPRRRRIVLPIRKRGKKRSLEKCDSNNHNMKKRFSKGNYSHYYEYRNPEDKWGDYRMQLLRREWFYGKRCLDIGCNAGILTILLALEYECKHIVGIDVDTSLIIKARNNIKMQEQYHENVNSTIFPNNVFFQTGDITASKFQLSSQDNIGTFDVVLGMSITKWLHFNGGDAAVYLMFKRVFEFLQPGGLFILEPQPWKSYAKKSNITPEIKKNFKSVSLRPEEFASYLTDTYEFELLHTLSPPTVEGTGFTKREILVFQKKSIIVESL